MKSALFALWIAASICASSARAAEASDEEVAARKVALDLAGAFSNEGFKLRDGHWMGALDKGKCAIIQVNLFAGNQYWFSLGATDAATKVQVSIFDEAGAPIAYEPYQEGSSAAAGFSPGSSGPYFIKVEEITGGPASFCLLYSYK